MGGAAEKPVKGHWGTAGLKHLLSEEPLALHAVEIAGGSDLPDSGDGASGAADPGRPASPHPSRAARRSPPTGAAGGGRGGQVRIGGFSVEDPFAAPRSTQALPPLGSRVPGG